LISWFNWFIFFRFLFVWCFTWRFLWNRFLLFRRWFRNY